MQLSHRRPHLGMSTNDLYLQVPEELRRDEAWFDEESGYAFLSVDEMRTAPFLQMVPVAKAYGGLGLWNVLFYVPEHNGWFLTRGGGSNSIDRHESEEFLKHHTPPESSVYPTWREALNQTE
jgi:hypothetical protein